MKRVLVAGAGSFPGKALAGYLDRQGYDVVGTTCRPEEAGGSLLPWDPMQPLPAAGAFDAILHAEGCIPLPGEDPGIWGHKRRSIDLTERILEMARQQGARVIYLSATDVHGEARETVLCEDAPRCSPSPFGEARYMGEELLRESGVPHIALRLPEVLGPGAPEGWLSGTVRQFLEHAEVRGGSPEALANSFIWIDDLAYFVEELLEMPRWRHRAVQLAAWRRTSLRALLEGIRKRTGSSSRIAWGSAAAPAPLLVDDRRAREMGFDSTGPMEIVRRILPAGISERLGKSERALDEIDHPETHISRLCGRLLDFPEAQAGEKPPSSFYERLWQSLRRRYRAIYLEVLDNFGISYFCFDVYYHAFEPPAPDELHVFLPIWDIARTPNRYLLRRSMEKMEVITPETSAFWKYVLTYHGKEIVFSPRYWIAEGISRCMDYRRIPFPRDFILAFPPEEEAEAQRQMQRMGLAGKEYVCIYARDNAWNKSYKEEAYGMGLRPVLQSNDDARNFDVEDYRAAVGRLAARGLWSVRMGSAAERPFEGDSVVDYATRYRTEMMDFYLLAHCRFFVCTNSGIFAIAMLFRTPMLFVNVAALSQCTDNMSPLTPKRDLMIPQKYWSEREGRYLGAREMLAFENAHRDAGIFRAYAKAGIEIRKNTPEEIADVVLEMENRLEGRRTYTPEEEALQERYREILLDAVEENHFLYVDARVGTEFLKQNPWFLA